MIQCKLCGQYFELITNTHLALVHNCSVKDYTRRFGCRGCGFPLAPNILPKHYVRYKKWKESLKKRPPAWCKGYTKETHPSVAKISKTFKRKKIDNFAIWREEMKRLGKIKSDYPKFEKNGDLAELIGVVLGDGHIGTFPRTEVLSIFSNADNKGFIDRYAKLVENIFEKQPTVSKNNHCNCVKITIYQKWISKRLEIPSGSRRYITVKIPQWILKQTDYLIRYLRGLYEAEGCFSIHKPTYTYKFIFSNRNKSLLENVYRGLQELGFHPHKSKDKIQLSRKKEVYRCRELLRFRYY